MADGGGSVDAVGASSDVLRRVLCAIDVEDVLATGSSSAEAGAMRLWLIASNCFLDVGLTQMMAASTRSSTVCCRASGSAMSLVPVDN